MGLQVWFPLIYHIPIDNEYACDIGVVKVAIEIGYVLMTPKIYYTDTAQIVQIVIWLNHREVFKVWETWLKVGNDILIWKKNGGKNQEKIAKNVTHASNFSPQKIEINSLDFLKPRAQKHVFNHKISFYFFVNLFFVCYWYIFLL